MLTHDLGSSNNPVYRSEIFIQIPEFRAIDKFLKTQKIQTLWSSLINLTQCGGNYVNLSQNMSSQDINQA